MVPADRPRSYYGRPVVKEPVWSPEIPAYFFVGGLAGASASLAGAAEATGNRTLGRNAGLVALTGVGISPMLLIKDLGVPARFLNMMRVFKVTSPMSVGSWVLAGLGPTAALASLHDVTGRLPIPGRVARGMSALLGLGLATYTAALLADTAVPAWHEARRELPFVFAGSAAASAGATAAAVTPPAESGPARRLTVLGVALETAAAAVMERRLGELAEPYRSGPGGRYAWTARALSVAGATVMALRGRRRAGALAGGALVLAGSAAQRWAVFEAGVGSARDPRYTVEPQRRRGRGG